MFCTPLNFEDAQRGIINSSKNAMLAWSSENEMIDERRHREEYALEIAKQN